MEWTRQIDATTAQVWDAIATGNGISSWFVPAEVDPGVGGYVVMHLGPEMDSTGRITAWRPPERLVYEERLGVEESGRPKLVFTEFIVGPSEDGRTTLTLVSGGDVTNEDLDELFESMEGAWDSFLDNLAIYVEGHAGEACGSVMIDATPDRSIEDALRAMLEKLGLESSAPGDRADLDPGAGGTASGAIARRNEHELAIRMELPLPGIIEFSAFTWGGDTHVRVHSRHFGEGAVEAATAASGAWSGWLADLFPEAEVSGM